MSEVNEWTKENMAGKWSRGEDWIIKEHNAALGAEREAYQRDMEEAHRALSNAKAQLAAEREKSASFERGMTEAVQELGEARIAHAAEREVGHNQAVTLGQHIARLEDQLAAAVEALKEIREAGYTLRRQDGTNVINAALEKVSKQ